MISISRNTHLERLPKLRLAGCKHGIVTLVKAGDSLPTTTVS
jgi:hypothetical protein